MLNTHSIFNELKETMDARAAETITHVISQVYEELRNSVTKTEFNELKEIVRNISEDLQSLAKSQKEMADEQVGIKQSLKVMADEQIDIKQTLQILADEQVGIKQSLKVMADEQIGIKQTLQILADEQVGIKQSLKVMADEQIGIKQTLQILAEEQIQFRQAQKELAEEMKKLAEAQRRTDANLVKLQKQVGGLSDTIGADFEEIAYSVLYGVLRKEYGWDVGVLEHTWQKWGEQIEEVDLFGKAVDSNQSGKNIWIVGETKHNLTLKEVKKFEHKVNRARKYLDGDIYPICFCRRARPEVQNAVRNAGFHLVFAGGRLLF